MKILHWNILDGCEDVQRRKRLLSSIKLLNCDVVCLNELNGWHDNNTMKQISLLCGYKYNFVLNTSHSGHSVGVMSKLDFELHQTNQDECSEDRPFWHGLLHIKIKGSPGLHLFITHLTPTSALKRMRECEEIVKRTDSVSANNEPLLLLGDLNTLSPHDSSHYDQNLLVQSLLSKSNSQSLTEKFLKHQDGKIAIDYDPMNILLSQGQLKDLSHCYFDGRFMSTVPTKMNYDASHATEMRLDYIMCNQKYSDSYYKSTIIQVLKGDEFQITSDHLPLMITFDL
ncbi:hypothetical protein AKO1_008953 [Acrasis kona]|uniref:Endonuclease/exonuclease/phosphatase domain-containing protein n=1 Tax=Acrasis kona TaxID=1008807 RepID=A0AAW2ZFF7_9EUKA